MPRRNLLRLTNDGRRETELDYVVGINARDPQVTGGASVGRRAAGHLSLVVLTLPLPLRLGKEKSVSPVVRSTSVPEKLVGMK